MISSLRRWTQSRRRIIFIVKRPKDGALPGARRAGGLRRGLVFFGLVSLASLACVVQATKPTDDMFNPPALPITITPAPPTATRTAAPLEPTRLPDTPTPIPPTYTPAPVVPNPPFLYYAQQGDTLPVLAVRFGVDPAEIVSPDPIPATALIPINQLLIIPSRVGNTTSSTRVMPDSEVVYSPSTIGFDIQAFVQQAGGYLSKYREYLGTTGWTSGAEIVQRVALENSVNPRLLLALLEYQGGWVYGQPKDALHTKYPLGYTNTQEDHLYQQLIWAVNKLSIGYYGWREGLLTEVAFSDGVKARLAPDLNAGTAALQYYLAQVYSTQPWVAALDEQQGLPALYDRMFGNAWLRAAEVEPLFTADLVQPELNLPFFYNQVWSYSGGPHGAWEHDGARAALDFAPGGMESGCVPSDAWVVSASAGVITRSGHATLVVDLDGDGFEQTGWVLLYLHLIPGDQPLQVGDFVAAGDLLGHPSCEGGFATGTHIHLARKYNGEWALADGPTPFVLSGWTARAGPNPYEGTMIRASDVITANVYGSSETQIIRKREPVDGP